MSWVQRPAPVGVFSDYDKKLSGRPLSAVIPRFNAGGFHRRGSSLVRDPSQRLVLRSLTIHLGLQRAMAARRGPHNPFRCFVGLRASSSAPFRVPYAGKEVICFLHFATT